MKQFKIHFDGGARPTNPGNGYGSFEVESGLEYKRRGERIEFGWMSNNAAEYMALLHGLKALLEDIKQGSLANQVYPGGITLSMYSDSKLVVEQMSGRWKIKKENIKTIHDECRVILKEFAHWRIRWNSRKCNVARFGH